VVLGIVAVLYFAPAIIAHSRNVPNKGSVFVINLFLGWTFIGWVVALAMAARSVPADRQQRKWEPWQPPAQQQPPPSPPSQPPAPYWPPPPSQKQPPTDAS
jgi:hypothetical protein